MPITAEEWDDVHVGDVLINDRYGHAYVVTDTGGEAVTLTRCLTVVDGSEWTRMRKTVDVD